MSVALNRRTRRRGFTMIEVMIALVILAGVVLVMGMGTTKLSRAVTNSDIRNRAQSVAEMQIGRARAWPSYATLSNLTAGTFNGTSNGLVSTTTVSVDSTLGKNVTLVTVSVAAVQSSLMPTPIIRSISIAAP